MCMSYLILAPHIHVSSFFAKNFTKDSVKLDCPFLVATPTRDTLLVKEAYRSCKVTIGKMDIVANLMLLDMTDFDIILGMDWLASCHASLDCHDKAIKFNISGNPLSYFKVNGVRYSEISYP